MPQYELNLRDYWRIIHKRKWIIILSFAIVVGASIIFSFRQKPFYKASTRVKIEEKKSMAGLLVELVSWSSGDPMVTQTQVIWSSGDPMVTQTQVITSRRIAEETAKRMELVDENTPQKEFDAIVTNLKNSISTERILRTNIIEVTVTAENPRKAIKTVNIVTQVYIDESLKEKIEQAHTVLRFIEERLQMAEESLKKSEEALKKFKEEGAIGSLSTKKDLILKNLNQVQADLIKTKTEREEIGQLMNQLKEGGKIGRVLQASSVLDNDPLSSTLKKELIDLESESSILGKYYTEKHPKILKVKEKIALVSGRLQERLESRIGILQREENRLKPRGKRFGRELKLLPTKELELDRLQRNLRASEERYKSLKEKFDNASIAEAEKTSDITQIDKAVSATTIATGKKTVALAGGMIGLVLGLVFAFVREGMDTSIGTIEDVESYLKVPVLGVIPHIEEEGERTGFLRRKPKIEETVQMRARLKDKYRISWT
jgi:uncharacterized protein involved in exopolysaccharide biosynthesis